MHNIQALVCSILTVHGLSGRGRLVAVGRPLPRSASAEPESVTPVANLVSLRDRDKQVVPATRGVDTIGAFRIKQ